MQAALACYTFAFKGQRSLLLLPPQRNRHLNRLNGFFLLFGGRLMDLARLMTPLGARLPGLGQRAVAAAAAAGAQTFRQTAPPLQQVADPSAGVPE